MIEELAVTNWLRSGMFVDGSDTILDFKKKNILFAPKISIIRSRKIIYTTYNCYSSYKIDLVN